PKRIRQWESPNDAPAAFPVEAPWFRVPLLRAPDWLTEVGLLCCWRIRMNRPLILRRLTVAMLLMSLCSTAIFFGSVHVRADGNSDPGNGSAIDKCSPDLIALVQADPNAQVKAIVQSTASPGLLDSLLQTVGATVLAIFPNLNARLIQTTAGAARTLAYQD